MLIRDEHLIKLNSKNKIQHVHLQLEHDVINSNYIIKRTTNQFGGKETIQPDIVVSEGKVKRTVSEQATLQFLSHLKKYIDGGCKKLSSLTQKKYEDLTEIELSCLLGSSFNTDSKGIPKPMLAKSCDDLGTDTFEREWYCSKKLDGE